MLSSNQKLSPDGGTILLAKFSPIFKKIVKTICNFIFITYSSTIYFEKFRKGSTCAVLLLNYIIKNFPSNFHIVFMFCNNLE